MKPSAVSPFIRDVTRVGLGAWALSLGIYAAFGAEESLGVGAGVFMACSGLLLLTKRLGMVATLLGTAAFFLMRLDPGGWAWIWLLWPTAKLYGRRKRAFRFGFWFLIYLHVLRWQTHPEAWWSEWELWLALSAVIPFLAPYAWALLSILILIIMPVDPDWNIPIFAMHLLTFNMNWLPAPKNHSSSAVIRFDSMCPMCHKLVDLLVREDRRSFFFFSPAFQDATAITVETSTGIYRGYEALLFILDYLGGYWRFLAAMGKWIPSPMGNLAYNFVAKNRYRIVKPLAECRIRPDLHERWIP